MDGSTTACMTDEQRLINKTVISECGKKTPYVSTIDAIVFSEVDLTRGKPGWLEDAGGDYDGAMAVVSNPTGGVRASIDYRGRPPGFGRHLEICEPAQQRSPGPADTFGVC